MNDIRRVEDDGSDQSLGARVRRARRVKDWTLGDLAQKMNVRISLISSIENNQLRPSRKFLSNLSEILEDPSLKSSDTVTESLKDVRHKFRALFLDHQGIPKYRGTFAGHVNYAPNVIVHGHNVYMRYACYPEPGVIDPAEVVYKQCDSVIVNVDYPLSRVKPYTGRGL